MHKLRLLVAVLLLALTTVAAAPAAVKEILLIAGAPSHGPGQHEHNAGVRLLAKWLSAAAAKDVHVTVSLDGAWPEPAALERADAIFLFSDGSGSHPVFKGEERVADIAKAAARGAGLMFHHYATEPPDGKGREEMFNWIGGFFELNYSVNPHWDADFTTLPSHPIARGVKPFKIRDEWYFNIRFPERKPASFTPILAATPPAEVFSERDGPRLGNADVRSKRGQPQTVAWAIERADGGRGVGWTGGHFHRNLGDENFRKLILNALLWIAKVEVPAGGVQAPFAENDLTENLDVKRRPERK